jgi:transposase InsO family protein
MPLVFLACVLDLASKEIVGYALSQTPVAKLADEALLDAVHRQQLNRRKLMFHSDQGVQYPAKIVRDKLALLNIMQSMSHRANCTDNTVMERFFRSLKTERLNNITFINHASEVDEVESYIRFYNYKRRHSSLGYMTPHQKYNKLKNVA